MKNPLLQMYNPLLYDRVRYGGYWSNRPSTLRSTRRDYYWPTNHSNGIGFRLFRTQEKS